MEVFVSVVTGSYKGIGREIVKQLSERCCRPSAVVMTSRNTESGLKSLKGLQDAGHNNVYYHQLDISDEDSIQEFCNWIKYRKDDSSTGGGWGKIDLLVNNAGIAFENNDKTPKGQQAKVSIQNNYFDTKNFTKKCGDLLADSSRIVTVASQCGETALKSSVQFQKRVETMFADGNVTEEKLDMLAEEYISAAENGEEYLREKHFPTNCYGMSKALEIMMVYMWGKRKPDWLIGNKAVTFISMCPGWCKSDMAGWENPPREAAEGAADALFCCEQDNSHFETTTRNKKFSKDDLQGQFVKGKEIINMPFFEKTTA